MVFDEELARTFDHRLKGSQSQFLDKREEALLFNLTAPREGESFLEIGCGTASHLRSFHHLGCQVTGIDPSAALLERAAQRLGSKTSLHLGGATDLPFSDNEFDIVSLLLPVTFAEDVEEAVGEAIRVSRGRVFIGFVNRYSLAGLAFKMRQFIDAAGPRPSRVFRFGQLKVVVRRLLPGVSIQWGSVIYLPASWYGFAAGLEEAVPMMKNPFGAILGLSFPVTYTLRTVQDLIGDSFQLKPEEGRPVQGIIRAR